MSDANRSSSSRAGVGGVLLVCCLALAVAGVGADAFIDRESAFWLGAEAGGAAAIGAGAAAFAILASFAARFILAPRATREDKRHARPDA